MKKQTPDNSPFNWKGKPSIFSKEQDYNGVNSERSRKASKLEKNDLLLPGAFIQVRERELTTYSRAVLERTKEVFGETA